MAEAIYQNLVPNFYKDAPMSVHLCSFPVCDEKAIDLELENGMQDVLDIVVLGRASRNTSNIKNRQPLSKVYVCAENKQPLNDELLDIAKEELNVKEIEYLNDAGRFVNYKLKPQLKTLGPKYGAKLGQIRKFFEVCDANEIVNVVKNGGVFKADFEGDTFEFNLDDLLISSESMAGFVSSSDKGITIVLDTNLTDQLIAEGVERELVSKIQSMRKDAGFEVVDRINVNYLTESKLVIDAFNSGNVASVVLADYIVNTDADGFRKDLDINGAKCTVIINKVIG
jgi:isoleucyl-tRNA synthetase